MPEFQAAFAAYEGDVNFVGLAVEDAQESALALVERTGVEYPSSLDNSRELADQLEPLGFPHTVLLDERGAIIESQTGQLDRWALYATIEDRLGVPAPEVQGEDNSEADDSPLVNPGVIVPDPSEDADG